MINFQIHKNGQQIEFEKNNVNFNDKNFQSLFIFHGLYGRGKNWQTFSKKLSKEENQIVVTVDLRNHGGNDFEEDLTYILMMNDIVSLFNYLGVENTNILGHSMGGKLAMVIALLEPKYINKVIIVTSSFHIPRTESIFSKQGISADSFPVDFKALGYEINWTFFFPSAHGFYETSRGIREYIGRLYYYLKQ